MIEEHEEEVTRLREANDLNQTQMRQLEEAMRLEMVLKDSAAAEIRSELTKAQEALKAAHAERH